MSTRPNAQEIITDPAAHYDAPAGVLSDTNLDSETKQKILESWRLDAVRLQASEGENMTGGEPNRLGEVDRALRELKTGAA
jgi:hypothetical protein